MKSIVLFISLTWFGTIFSQENVHFLLTSVYPIHVTDAVCKDIAESSKEELVSQIDQVNRNQKKEGLKTQNRTLSQQAYFELLQSFRADPDHVFPLFPLTQLLFKTYRSTHDESMYFSAQKVTLKSIGPAHLEVSIKNVQVSSSETALDMEVRNLKNPETPIQTNHFSCPTGRMLMDEMDYLELPWIFFWQKFYQEVKAQEWLEVAIFKVEPSLVSQGMLDKQSDERINQLGLTSKENLSKGAENAKRIFDALLTHQSL